MVLASVFKVALVTALYRTELDLTQRVEIDARSGGPTGVSAMLDPVALSLRDLAYQALAVSDNAAADVLFDTVGDAPVAELLRELGLAAHAHPAPLPRHGRRARRRRRRRGRAGLAARPTRGAWRG